MFTLQNHCDGLVDFAHTILSQFVRLQKSPLLYLLDKLYGFTQFYLQDKVRKFPTTFLRCLCPTSFSKVTYDRVIRVFHKLVKHSTISQFEAKQNALSDLRGIVNALCTSEDKGLKNNHPFSAPLPSTDPVKFYRQNSYKYLPEFPRMCVIALGWKTNKFFSPLLPLTVLLYSPIQVFS